MIKRLNGRIRAEFDSSMCFVCEILSAKLLRITRVNTGTLRSKAIQLVHDVVFVANVGDVFLVLLLNYRNFTSFFSSSFYSTFAALLSSSSNKNTIDLRLQKFLFPLHMHSVSLNYFKWSVHSWVYSINWCIFSPLLYFVCLLHVWFDLSWFFCVTISIFLGYFSGHISYTTLFRTSSE